MEFSWAGKLLGRYTSSLVFPLCEFRITIGFVLDVDRQAGPIGETNSMKQTTREARDLARQLLAQEAGGDSSAATVAHAAVCAFDKIRVHLTKLVGVAGFQALMVRSLAMAKAEVRWLEAVRVLADGSLAGFEEAVQEQEEADAERGSTTLLAHLLALLTTFIGEYLTLRVICDVWPNAPLTSPGIGSEEIVP